mmetsp:Transcript_105453/g.305018  ORF Transcript_105453/g.305018 Transcript_105453/m.305018 type:complete len:255 (+) Transcript_105453:37-801(+)
MRSCRRSSWSDGSEQPPTLTCRSRGDSRSDRRSPAHDRGRQRLHLRSDPCADGREKVRGHRLARLRRVDLLLDDLRRSAGRRRADGHDHRHLRGGGLANHRGADRGLRRVGDRATENLRHLTQWMRGHAGGRVVRDGRRGGLAQRRGERRGFCDRLSDGLLHARRHPLWRRRCLRRGHALRLLGRRLLNFGGLLRGLPQGGEFHLVDAILQELGHFHMRHGVGHGFADGSGGGGARTGERCLENASGRWIRKAA